MADGAVSHDIQIHRRERVFDILNRMKINARMFTSFKYGMSLIRWIPNSRLTRTYSGLNPVKPL
jgi:hypothetical protein